MPNVTQWVMRPVHWRVKIACYDLMQETTEHFLQVITGKLKQQFLTGNNMEMQIYTRIFETSTLYQSGFKRFLQLMRFTPFNGNIRKRHFYFLE